MAKDRKKLVLFDVDGTLTHRVGDYMESLGRFPYAVEKAFGLKLTMGVDDYMKYNGWIDKAMAWEWVKDKGINRREYVRKFPLYEQYLLEYMEGHKPVYQAARGAKSLVARLSHSHDGMVGLITGNVEAVAWWKLRQAGLAQYFHFGLFGGEANSRIDLARSVFAKAKKVLKIDISPKDIIIIGDTVHDVFCAKAISAAVILVLTGGRNSEVPEGQKPDLVVRSLADKAIVNFLESS